MSLTSTEKRPWDTPDVPDGVLCRLLEAHADARGDLAEIFRSSWDTGIQPLQWNLIRSEAGILRGVHVHPRHTDYVVLLTGTMSLGLSDVRPDSPTFGLGVLLELDGRELAAVTIPPGVAHGFYFGQASTVVYASSEFWDPSDEVACHWADQELGIAWPTTSPVLSAKDANAPTLAQLRPMLNSVLRGSVG